MKGAGPVLLSALSTSAPLRNHSSPRERARFSPQEDCTRDPTWQEDCSFWASCSTLSNSYSLFSSFPWQLFCCPSTINFPRSSMDHQLLSALNLIPLPLKAESHSNNAHTEPASWPQEPRPSVADTARGQAGTTFGGEMPLRLSYHFLERMVKHHLRRKNTWKLSV